MRGLLVCTLVLALALANGDSPCICNYGHGLHRPRRSYSSLQAKVDAQTARISRLSGHIQALQDKLNDGAEKGKKVQNQQADINDRLAELDPHICKENEFYCGDADNKCVSKQLVCDEVADCGSKSDEDSHRCTNPAHSGSVFVADIHSNYSTCSSLPLNSIKLFITSERRLKWFPSQILIDATIELDRSTDEAHQVVTLPGHGYYEAAHRRLVIHPITDDHLGIICEFDSGHGDHCHGHTVREATLSRCQTYYLRRQ